MWKSFYVLIYTNGNKACFLRNFGVSFDMLIRKKNQRVWCTLLRKSFNNHQRCLYNGFSLFGATLLVAHVNFSYLTWFTWRKLHILPKSWSLLPVNCLMLCTCYIHVLVVEPNVILILNANSLNSYRTCNLEVKPILTYVNFIFLNKVNSFFFNFHWLPPLQGVYHYTYFGVIDIFNQYSS